MRLQVQIQRRRNKFDVQRKPNSQKSKTTVSEGKTRVSIGVALPRWRALKEEKGMREDTDVALFLLDW